MTDIEKDLHEVRNQTNKQIKQLAEMAIADSTTYLSAIQKLKDFKWKFSDQTSLLVIELAIEHIEKKALETEL